MKRVSHTLRRNERVTFPTHHIFVDIETKRRKINENVTEEVFYLGWACSWRRRGDGKNDKEKWFFFRKEKDFWDFVCREIHSKETTILCGHNVRFDLLGLKFTSNLRRRNYKLQNFYDEDPVLILPFKNGTRRIKIVDNQNWFRGKLEDWGKYVGLEKIEVDFDNCTDEELSAHCKRDVEILLRLWRWWYKLIEENELGRWAPTLAGQAFNAYRHRFMKHDIFILADEEVSKIEREAYFGGRCTPFFQGVVEGKEVYHLDVNSMYPFVMKDNYFPAGLVSKRKKCPLWLLKDYLSRYCVIARVKISPTEPVFPQRLKDRIVYPTYTFITTLTTPELKYALRRGWIIEVYDTICYRREKLFTEYIEFFYEMKKRAKEEKDILKYNLAKLFLNSLYGKFGQYSHQFKEVGTCDPNRFESIPLYDRKTRTWRRIYFCCGKVWEREKRKEAFNAFPAIAAHVTAYARLHLWKLVKKAGRKNCYYCDTDSVFVNERGLKKLKPFLSPTKLGFLKEKEKGTDFEVIAAKHYRFKQKWIIKGIKSKAREIACRVFEQEKFPSLTGAMTRYGREAIYIVKEIKKLKGEIKWGWVDKFGWVHPFTSFPSFSRSPP